MNCGKLQRIEIPVKFNVCKTAAVSANTISRIEIPVKFNVCKTYAAEPGRNGKIEIPVKFNVCKTSKHSYKTTALPHERCGLIITG